MQSKTNVKKRLLAGAAISSGVLTAFVSVPNSAARAADAPVIEEIVVTAQKREERLVDTPLTVTVLSADQLVSSGYTSFRDYADTIPGLSYHSSGPGINQISLRGVSVGNDISATVGVYLDDVPIGPSSSFTKGGIVTFDPSLLDLDRLEVLKGPQGTLYGASTMGGLLKYTTKLPDSKSFEGEAQAGVSGTQHGSANYDVSAMINAPLGDKVAVRASGFETHEGGYIDNVLLHTNNVNSSDVYGGRVDMLFTPTDNLSIRISGLLQDTRTNGFPFADYGVSGVPVTCSLCQSRHFPEFFDYNFRLASGTITYNLDWASLISISSYQTATSNLLGDLLSSYGVFAAVPSFYSNGLSDQQSTDKFTQEVRLSSGNSKALEWIIGGFYTDEKSQNHQAYSPTAIGGQPLPNTYFTFFVPSTYDEYAAFGDLTYHFSPKFDVTGGIRYAENEQTFQQFGGGTFGLSSPKSTATEDAVTWLANARYHLTDNATAYFRYSTGYRPGGPNYLVLNTTTGALLAPPTVQHDSLASYEVGFKAETDGGRFGIDLSGYYIDWSNIQVTVTVGGFGTHANAPSGATIRGTELTLTAHPIDAFTATAAFGYVDPKFSGPVPSLGAVQDQRLADVPPFTTTFTADYELPWGNWKPTIGGKLHYQDGAMNGYAVTGVYHLPGYTTLDLHLGFTLDRVHLQFYANNVTDERGELAPRLVLYPATGPFQVSIIQPRTIGLQASAKF